MVDKGRLWIALAASVFLLAAVVALAALTIVRGEQVLAPPAGTQATPVRIAPGAQGEPIATPAGDQVAQPPAGGGAAERARLDDSVDYIIRDRSGKIKDRQAVGAR